MVLMLEVKSADGGTRQVRLRLRVETPIEVAYLENGGILPFVLQKLLHA